MNEEQAVFDFFSKPDNLALALTVAELVDDIRFNMNNDFWRKTALLIADRMGDWKIVLTENKHTPDCIVGLSLQPAINQQYYLFPMMEQEMTGKEVRIYYGLAWNAPPTPSATALAEISTLQSQLQASGYKNNERFIGWRWTSFYPRRKQSLLNLSRHSEGNIAEAALPLTELVSANRNEINLANAALKTLEASSIISLDHLRMNLPY